LKARTHKVIRQYLFTLGI